MKNTSHEAHKFQYLLQFRKHVATHLVASLLTLFQGSTEAIITAPASGQHMWVVPGQIARAPKQRCHMFTIRFEL